MENQHDSNEGPATQALDLPGEADHIRQRNEEAREANMARLQAITEDPNVDVHMRRDAARHLEDAKAKQVMLEQINIANSRRKTLLGSDREVLNYVNTRELDEQAKREKLTGRLDAPVEEATST